jgi:hypothetical protein
MSRVSEYRNKAAEFIALAAKSSDLNSRIMLLELAGTLASLANSVERNENENRIAKDRVAKVGKAA